jgi:predicted transcriptional regulator
MPSRAFYFDPTAEGAAVFMGPTEARLMEIAWSKESLTVKQALFHLGESNRLAYTTVMTVLSRLADKQFLSREKAGRTFVYRPTVNKETFLKTRVGTVSDCLAKNFAELR